MIGMFNNKSHSGLQLNLQNNSSMSASSLASVEVLKVKNSQFVILLNSSTKHIK